VQEAYRSLLGIHVALGSLALVAFWGALLARKGSLLHRGFGRVFVGSMAAAVLSALPLCAAVQLVDPFRIRPPEPGLDAAELAAYPEFIRGLFRGLAGIGLFALFALARGLRAVRRGRIVEHVGWILASGVVGHTALFVSIVPRLLPGIYERDPTQDPLPWILPPLVGGLAVAGTCRAVGRRLAARAARDIAAEAA
jgi:uncharacterized membrane protein